MESQKQISDLIFKLKRYNGEERKILEKSIKRKFQIGQNEKFVVSKLRMMLIQMGAEVSSLHLISTGAATKQKNQMIQGKKLKTDNIVEKGSCKAGSKKNRRLTKEEKQLQKIRQNKFIENDRTLNGKIQNSKILYLKAYGLEPSIICLD